MRTGLAISRFLDLSTHGRTIVCALEAIHRSCYTAQAPKAPFCYQSPVSRADRALIPIFSLSFFLSSFSVLITSTLLAFGQATIPSVFQTRFVKLPHARRAKMPQASPDQLSYIQVYCLTLFKSQRTIFLNWVSLNAARLGP